MRPRSALASLWCLLVALALLPGHLDAAALNATCFAPTTQGGLGFCGPAACNASAVRTTKPTCTFTSTAINYATSISSMGCRACVQSSRTACSKTALQALVVGTGIKAAYCTDAHLVIISDGTPSWTANLDDVPNPPGSVQPGTGAACVTRSGSVTPSLLKWKIPLDWTLLSTAASTNNMAAFPDGAADSAFGYMANNRSGISYGLPTRGSVGVSVSGTDMFPLFNNRAELTDDSCEVDSCNLHVGGGGGQPHLHGDPFGPWCLYSASNYTNQTAHPPQIGWSLDGPAIFGRHLFATSLGYATALDDCGGHQHDSLPYHYHTQVLDATTTTPITGLAQGISYTYSTVGVNKCWRADISKILGFWDQLQNSTYFLPCCNMTQYYTAPGITFPTLTTTTASPIAPPTTSVPAAPPCTLPSTSPAPAPAPGLSPSTTPSSSPTATPSTTPTKGTACPKGNGVSTSVTKLLKGASGNALGIDVYQISATGCPGQDWSGQTTPNSATYQNYVWTVPVTPVIASAPTYVARLLSYPSGSTNANPIMGSIGLGIDGVTVFNDADADKRDAYVYESQSFDRCRGHNNQDGAYHRHSEPTAGCVYTDTAGQHSPVFAIMADGIPLFGVYGDGGKVPTDLDACGAHTDSTYPFLHYHLPANLTAPYVITCLRGCIFNNQGNPNFNSHVKTSSTCSPASTQYNYSSLSIPWTGVTSVATVSAGRRRAQAGTPSPVACSTAPPACPTGTVKTGTSKQCCGDGVCDGPETLSTCAADCSASTSPTAGASVPSASSPSTSSPSPTPPTYHNKRVQNTFSGMDYNALTANATQMAKFSSDVQLSYATAANVSTSNVKVLAITPGSVVVTCELSFPTTQYTAAQADQVVSTAVSSPSTVFPAAFTTTYGVTALSAAEVTPSPPSSSDGLSTGTIIGIAVGAGVGGLVLLALLAFFLMKRKGSAPAPGAPPPNPVKVHPVDHDV